MSTPDHQKVTTEKLRLVKSLDDLAAEEFIPIIYDELRRLASRYIRHERPGHPLQPTDLVHEAYARLIDGTMIQINDREHFMALAAKAMRRVLVDYARRENAKKRAGDRVRITFTEAMLFTEKDILDVLALNDALDKFKELDERASQVVELRFFAGLTVPEVSNILKVSTRTVEGDWTIAKAWLIRELKNES